MKYPTVGVMYISLALFTSGAAIADDGASTYRMVCSSCHGSGVNDAPTLKDKANWRPRLAQGQDALYTSLVNGKCKVFVKDLRKDLSDDNIKAAIDYMVTNVK